MLTRSTLLFFSCVLVLALFAGCPRSKASRSDSSSDPARLRLSVALTPEELTSFRPAIKEIDPSDNEWDVVLELTPQQSVVERVTAQLAAGDLPDIFRMSGLLASRWIRQDVFLDLSPRVRDGQIEIADLYSAPIEQFRWKERLYGVPDTAAPDVLYYNRSMFDAADVPYPSAEWTYEEMREAAQRLTIDENGRNASESRFDPDRIVQWGWNGGLTFFWQRHLVQAFGADFCVNSECTEMIFTNPATIAAVQWWADMTNLDHTALYDPYGGSQTGVPGDPFLSGKAAMGYNGFFAVGQLNNSGAIDYDIAEPFLGIDGYRRTPLSTTGYLISATTDHPEDSWVLVQALTAPEFEARTWGRPGHGVPVARDAANSIFDPSRRPSNQDVILRAMEYGQVYKPYTASAFEVYSRTASLFLSMMKGDVPVPEALEEIEAIANDILSRDR